MAKFSGLVGYGTHVEIKPGVWENQEKTQMMKGDFLRQNASVAASNRTSSMNTGKVNADVTLNHRVSLIGDAYSFDNYYNMKWIMIDGRKWGISDIEVQRPRLIVSLGGVWNG